MKRKLAFLALVVSYAVSLTGTSFAGGDWPAIDDGLPG